MEADVNSDSSLPQTHTVMATFNCQPDTVCNQPPGKSRRLSGQGGLWA